MLEIANFLRTEISRLSTYQLEESSAMDTYSCLVEHRLVQGAFKCHVVVLF